ncbi:MAG: glycosyltransferase [Thermoanaerobaculia bacterium]
MLRDRLRILFGGACARVPGQGGLDWVVLQYVLGLRRLGHDVLLVEPVSASDLRPDGADLAESENALHLQRLADSFGLRGAAALVLVDGRQSAGLPYAQVERYAREADLVIDIAGGLFGTGLLASPAVRLYLDLDPGFTQLWHAVEGIDMRLDGHTHFATVGLAFDRAADTIPRCGREWITTPQPVVLDQWPFAERLERDAWTTVANWRGYGSIQINGTFFGQKAHSLRRLIDLPRRTAAPFELALAIDPGELDDLAALAEGGWHLVDPAAVAGSAQAYRRFIQGSRGELGVAKSGYVESRCGWFSDRSACYLASGRPVIAQETGFSEVLPVGAGLFSFESAEDVEAALEELNVDYDRHRRAARDMAEEHFDSDRVLRRLLTTLGAAA